MSTALGNEAREMVTSYGSRTGLSMGQVAREAGVGWQTVRQFMADCYPHNEDSIATTLIKWVKSNPPEIDDVEGKLYPTENVKVLDQQIAAAWEGGVSLIYGPPGTQKSFVFQRRVAEALRSQGLDAPRIGYIYAGLLMGRLGFTSALTRVFCCYTRGVAHQAIQNTVHALRRRAANGGGRSVLIVDEAQHLCNGDHRQSMHLLEALRELVDRAGIGLIVAGHDRLEQIFDPANSPLEQFVQRIDYRLRLPGLSEKEVCEISAAELGAVSDRASAEILKACEARDQHQRRAYYSARYLFKVIAQVRARRKSAAH